MKLYITDSNHVNKEGLRVHVIERLNALEQEASFLLHDPRYHTFWNRLHDVIVTQESKESHADLLGVESQLRHVPQFIEAWKQMAVETPERFEFFVRSKAQEIASGDTDHDYYWALYIRHDQLLGLVGVLEQLLEYMRSWVEKPTETVIQDGVFLGIGEKSIEEQIFLEAEKVKDAREAVSS